MKTTVFILALLLSACSEEQCGEKTNFGGHWEGALGAKTLTIELTDNCRSYFLLDWARYWGGTNTLTTDGAASW